jgi:lipoprotein-releasing system ATP-binding protein
VSETILNTTDLVKEFQMGGTVLKVLKGVSLDLEVGQIAAIIGKSGAGKSTLLHILGMLDRPSSGQLVFRGEELGSKSDDELAAFRNRSVGFIFQFHHLLPEFNALENVLMPAMISGNHNKASINRAKYLLDRVGLSERLKHRPGELSGGELQRVAVARSLINEPCLILADEPSGNLDLENSEMLHDLIWGLARENNLTFVIVTHDMTLAKRADRILHLNDGIMEEMDHGRFIERFM